jgi:aryl-alcohol dehydrogenase-like predicted oxidoreductase
MLNGEVRRGRIRYFAASNWRCDRLAAANAYAAANGVQGFVASSPQWSLAVPRPLDDPTMHALDNDDIRWHEESQLPVIPYTSTAGGYFARTDDGGDAGDRVRRERARQLAAELHCTPNQIALAWLRGHAFPVVPIIGTVNPAHLDDALGVASVTLSPTQVRWLADGE